MAFTVDLTENEGAEISVDSINRHFSMTRDVDFTEAANQLIQTATMGLFLVPAYVLIEEVMLLILTADTDITDVDIGRYSTLGVVAAVDAFVDGATLAATGLVRDLAGETYSRTDGTAGYMGEADWAIGLINNDADAINGAVVRFIALGVDLRA